MTNAAATIVAAIATAVLAVVAIFQWIAMKENNEAAERQKLYNVLRDTLNV